jgi:phosphatidylserine/phosphatidylglycerophosphate/cardiolipin synthase-like enzyme
MSDPTTGSTPDSTSEPTTSVFESLVEYQMGAGSPVSQFFASVAENSRDPFRAAADISIRFTERFVTQELERSAAIINEGGINRLTDPVRADFLLRMHNEHLQYTIQSESAKISSSLGHYNQEMQRVTGITYESYTGSGSGRESKRIDTYSAPSGFIARPLHYDTYSLFASEESKQLNLRMSIYQLQEINTVAGIAQREKDRTEIITQGYSTDRRGQTENFFGEVTSQADEKQQSLRVKSAGNTVGKRINLPSVFAANVLNEALNVEKTDDSMKGVTTVAMVDGSLHPKVGYLSDPKTGNVKIAFISTQNITSALSRGDTTEEMLVLRSDVTFTDPKRTDKRSELMSQLVDLTESIFEATRDKYNDNTKELQSKFDITYRKDIRAKLNKRLSARQVAGVKRSVYVNQDIHNQIANLLHSTYSAGDATTGDKVVISLQYIEKLFETTQREKDFELTGEGLDKQSKKFKDFKTKALNAILSLADQGRVSIAISGDSFGEGQGLFKLLDEYHSGNITGDKRTALETLLNRNVFSVLPSAYAHSKTLAILDDTTKPGDVKLKGFVIGSANISNYAYRTNVESSLFITDEQVEALTDSEQRDIANYYYHGVSNFNRQNTQGSRLNQRGSAKQTQRLIQLLDDQGAVDQRSKQSGKSAAPFTYARIYDPNRAGELIGLSLKIQTGSNSNYSFSVTVGEQVGQQGAVPIVYLSKNNRVINGMIFKNDSREVLELPSRRDESGAVVARQLEPGQTQSFDAFDTLFGMMNTMRHAMIFETQRGSVQKGISVLTDSTRQQSLQRTLSSILYTEANAQGLLNLTDSSNLTFGSMLSKFSQKGQLETVLNILEQKLSSEMPTVDQTGEPVPRNYNTDLNVIQRQEEIKSLFTEIRSGITDFDKPLGLGAQGLANNIVLRLDKLLQLSIDNEKQATIYTDILMLMIGQDEVAKKQFESAQQKAKRDVFSQITSVFFQPHELSYSFGQALYKKPVFGLNQQIYNLAEQQGTLGFILNPHRLRHGEDLGGLYFRAVADTVRYEENDLYQNLGGIYKAVGGPATIREGLPTFNSMRQIAIIDRDSMHKRAKESFIQAGLSEEQAEQRATQQVNKVFAISKFKGEGKGEDQKQMFFYPFRVTEQVVGRMRNLQSGRPVESSSPEFNNYARSLGVVGGDDEISLDSIIGGSILTSLPPHQFNYLQTLYNDQLEKDRDPAGAVPASLSDDGGQIVKFLKENFHGNATSLVRGFLGGATPKRVAQSFGISTMSDFAYINSDYEYNLDEHSKGTKATYSYLHSITMTFDTRQLAQNTSFAGRVTQTLKKGTTFLGRETLITQSDVYQHLTDELTEQVRQHSDGKAREFTDLDARQKKKVQTYFHNKYQVILFKDGEFFFRPGVHSPATGADIDERLRSKKIIGRLNQSEGFFTIDGLLNESGGLLQYPSSIGQEKSTELIHFKIPAFSQREYGGETVLYNDARVFLTNSNTTVLELDVATSRDMMSGQRPGSDTAKGPGVMVDGELFRVIEQTSGFATGDETLLSNRLANQNLYAVLAPSQVKGFNFESGFSLIEDEDSRLMNLVATGNRKVGTPVERQKGGEVVAQALAFLMLGSEVEGKRISTSLGENLVTHDDKKQFGKVLTKADGSGKPSKFGKPLGQKEGKIESYISISQAMQPTALVYSELGSLALPEYLRNTSISIEEALIKTVKEALEGNIEAREHLSKQASAIFEGARKSANALKFGDRYVFSEVMENRTASFLAYFIKITQDLFTDIKDKDRLQGPSISELNPAYFFEDVNNRKVGNEQLQKYTGVYEESSTVTTDEKQLNQVLTKSTQRIASAFNIKLPTPKDFKDAKDDSARTEELKEQLGIGLDLLDRLLRFNRFVEFGIEHIPSKIAVAVGMANMTKLEGQYVHELTKNQLSLYTYTEKEEEDVYTIQQAVILLGSLMEGSIPDPIRARSNLYTFKTTNLAIHSKNYERSSPTPTISGEEAERIGLTRWQASRIGVSSAFNFVNEFLSSFSRIASNALPNVITEKGDVIYSTPLAEDAIKLFLLGEDEASNEVLATMHGVRTITNSLSTTPSKDSIDNRRKALETKILTDLKASETKLNSVQTELKNILDSYTAARATNENLDFQEHVEVYKQSQITAGKTLITPVGYYTSLFTELGRAFNLSTDVTIEKIQENLTYETLSKAGVYDHYQAELNQRISASQGTELGTEYLKHGLTTLYDLATAFKGAPTDKLPLIAKDKERIQKRAQHVYDQITQTQRLVLPRIYIHSRQEGKYQVSFAPTDQVAPSQGLLLGLDLLQKLSLVFQGTSHAALHTQERLRQRLQSTIPIFEEISKNIEDSAENRISTGITSISEYQYRQILDLESTMKESIDNTLMLLDSQETIRQASVDRLKLRGISAIAMSSLLVGERELYQGGRLYDLDAYGKQSKTTGLTTHLLFIHHTFLELDKLTKDISEKQKQINKDGTTPERGEEINKLQAEREAKFEKLADGLQVYRTVNDVMNNVPSDKRNLITADHLKRAFYEQDNISILRPDLTTFTNFATNLIMAADVNSVTNNVEDYLQAKAAIAPKRQQLAAVIKGQIITTEESIAEIKSQIDVINKKPKLGITSDVDNIWRRSEIKELNSQLNEKTAELRGLQRDLNFVEKYTAHPNLVINLFRKHGVSLGDISKESAYKAAADSNLFITRAELARVQTTQLHQPKYKELKKREKTVVDLVIKQKTLSSSFREKKREQRKETDIAKKTSLNNDINNLKKQISTTRTKINLGRKQISKLKEQVKGIYTPDSLDIQEFILEVVEGTPYGYNYKYLKLITDIERASLKSGTENIRGYLEVAQEQYKQLRIDRGRNLGSEELLYSVYKLSTEGFSEEERQKAFETLLDERASILRDRQSTQLAVLREQTIKNSKELGKYLYHVIAVRQGAPHGSSLESESGTFPLVGLTYEDLRERTQKSGTLVNPAKKEARTLMLLSALGVHYTQLGDYDGDSFQAAVSQIGRLDSSILDLDNQLRSLEKGKTERKQSNVEPSKQKYFDELAITSLNEKRATLIAQREKLLQEQVKLREAALERSEKAVREFTKMYTGLPSELIEGGEDAVLKVDQLQEFTKQYRDTLANIYDNIDHVMISEGSYSTENLQKLKFTYDGTKYNVSDRDTLSAELLRQVDADLVEINNNLSNNPPKSGQTANDYVKGMIINRMAMEANVRTPVSISQKIQAAAFGSLLEEESLFNLQAIAGAGGTGLLGSTYNTIVPLVALRMTEIASSKVFNSEAASTYRMALALGLNRQINQINAKLNPDRSSSLGTISNEEKTRLAKEKAGLLAKRHQLLKNEETIADRLKLEEMDRITQVALRFTSTVQQFLRDATIKPKEDKAAAKKGQPPITLLEVAAEYTLSKEQLENYGIVAVDGVDGTRSPRGLSNLLSRVTGSSDSEIANRRESLLTTFLGEKLGAALLTGTGLKGTASAEVNMPDARAFAALKLITEYSQFDTATEMIQKSVFSSQLDAARQKDRYKDMANDQEFLSHFIADLVTAFESDFILGNVIEIDNRNNFGDSYQRIMDQYGLIAGKKEVTEDGKTKTLISITYDDSQIGKLREQEKNRLLLLAKRDAASISYDSEDSEGKQLDKYLDKYEQELIQRRKAIKTSLEALEASSTDSDRFKAAIKAVQVISVQQDTEYLAQNLQDLKQFQKVVKSIRGADGTPSDLEDNLNLYQQAFVQQLAAGKIDSQIWTGFFALALPQINEIITKDASETRAREGEVGKEIESESITSQAGIRLMTGVLPPSVQPTNYHERMASVFVTTAEGVENQKLSLAKVLLQTIFEDAGVVLNKEETEAVFNPITISSDEKMASTRQKFMEVIEESSLSEEQKIKTQETFGKGFDAISRIEAGTSPVELLRNASAYLYNTSFITEQMVSLSAQQRQNMANTDQSEEERNRLDREYQRVIQHLEESRSNLKAESSEGVEAIPSSNAQLDLQRELQTQFNEQINRVNQVQHDIAVRKASRVGRRINTTSELMSIVAVPLLFAALGDTRDPDKLGQAVILATDAFQELSYSHFVTDGVKQPDFGGWRGARVRHRLNTTQNTLEAMSTALVFEGMYRGTQEITKATVSTLAKGSRAFFASAGGRFFAESFGNITGMLLAGAVTGRSRSIPGESFTDTDVANSIIKTIVESTRLALSQMAEEVTEQLMSAQLEEAEGTFVEMVARLSDFNPNERFQDTAEATIYDNQPISVLVVSEA